jgi:universal stress protein F
MLMSDIPILAAVDLLHEDSDRHVVAEAIRLATSHNAPLHLVFVIPDQHHSYVQQYVPQDMKSQVSDDAKKELDRFASTLKTGGIAVQTHIRRGNVYSEIIGLSDDLKANFVVVGSNKPGLSDFFMGPNAARVARYAQCSVLVVRPER